MPSSARHKAKIENAPSNAVKNRRGETARSSAHLSCALDDRFHFDWVLLSRRYAHRRGLLDTVDDDERWSLVFVDDTAALYLRRAGAMAPLAERFAYQTLGGSRATMTARVDAARGDPTLRAAMEKELARQARETSVNFYGRAMERALEGR